MFLSKKQIDDYENLGVIIVRNIFKEWIEPLRVGFQKVLDKPSKYGRENVKKMDTLGRSQNHLIKAHLYLTLGLIKMN